MEVVQLKQQSGSQAEACVSTCEPLYCSHIVLQFCFLSNYQHWNSASNSSKDLPAELAPQIRANNAGIKYQRPLTTLTPK